MIKRLLMCMSAVMMLTAGIQDSYGDDFRLKYEDYEQLCKKLDDLLLWEKAQGLADAMSRINAAIRIGHIRHLLNENYPQADALRGIRVGDTIEIYYKENVRMYMHDRKIRVIDDDDTIPCEVNITDEEYQGQFKMFAGMLFDHFGNYDGKYHIPHGTFQQLTETLGNSDLAYKLRQIRPGNSMKIDAEFVID